MTRHLPDPLVRVRTSTVQSQQHTAHAQSMDRVEQGGGEPLGHGRGERDRHTALLSVGEDVEKIGPAQAIAAGQDPADAALNLPAEKHSPLRQLAAIEATRGRYDDAVQAISRATSQQARDVYICSRGEPGTAFQPPIRLAC